MRSIKIDKPEDNLDEETYRMYVPEEISEPEIHFIDQANDPPSQMKSTGEKVVQKFEEALKEKEEI